MGRSPVLWRRRLRRRFIRAVSKISTVGICSAGEIDFGPSVRPQSCFTTGRGWLNATSLLEILLGGSQSVIEVTRNAIMSASRFFRGRCLQGLLPHQGATRHHARDWSEVDAIFVPTTPTIYRVEEVSKTPPPPMERLSHYTNFVNLLDLCAIAVPSDFTANGLPVGVTFIAPAFYDQVVIELAEPTWRRRNTEAQNKQGRSCSFSGSAMTTFPFGPNLKQPLALARYLPSDIANLHVVSDIVRTRGVLQLSFYRLSR